ncbi:MAG: hypothetical protein ACLFS9_11655 [Nitriliruptoraceae bacterium]
MDLLTRHRAPLLLLAALFLIPIATSSLRGLTHVLTCAEEVGAAISISPALEPGEPPTLLSSQTLVAGEDPLICEALAVELSIGTFDELSGDTELQVDVANRSELDWRGTIELSIAGTRVPLAVGRIAAGETVSSRPMIRATDEQVEIEGQLLIGP